MSHLLIGYIKVNHNSKRSIFESVLKEHKLSTSNQLICSETLLKGGGSSSVVDV